MRACLVIGLGGALFAACTPSADSDSQPTTMQPAGGAGGTGGPGGIGSR